MKIKMKFEVVDQTFGSLSLHPHKTLCYSIINQVLPNKNARVHHCWILVDPLTNNEFERLSRAFATNGGFGHGVELNLYLNKLGEVLCDNNHNILTPSQLQSFVNEQRKHWDEHLIWKDVNEDDYKF